MYIDSVLSYSFAFEAYPELWSWSCLHGYSTGQEENDPLVLLAFEVTADIFAKSFQYGKWIVDFLPFGVFLASSIDDATVPEAQFS